MRCVRSGSEDGLVVQLPGHGSNGRRQVLAPAGGPILCEMLDPSDSCNVNKREKTLGKRACCPVYGCDWTSNHQRREHLTPAHSDGRSDDAPEAGSAALVSSLALHARIRPNGWLNMVKAHLADVPRDYSMQRAKPACHLRCQMSRPDRPTAYILRQTNRGIIRCIQ